MYFCNMIFRHLLNMRSHPTWVRGLKLLNGALFVNILGVAPYVGAWIETALLIQVEDFAKVAPYVGAWIETLSESYKVKSIPSRTLRGCVD